jgi:hypothetical protein
MILLVVKARYRTFGRRDRQTTVDWPVDSPPKDNLRPRVAPAWHTLCVLALLAILAALLAFLRMGSTTARLSNLGLYSVIIVCEWAIFAFTLRRSDTAFAGYIGAALRNPRAVWGCVFGVFAWLRKGLRANMIAHAALDIFSGF